jgi:hypothetical protein
MLRPAARQLMDYWSTLPKRDGVPARADFDPLAVRQILPIIVIIERRAPDLWLIRLAGTELGRRLGREVTGLNFIDLVLPPERKRATAIVSNVCDWPCGSLAIRETRMESGFSRQIETFALPLRAADGEARLAISVNDDVQAQPRLPSPDDPISGIVGYRSQRFIDIGAGVPGFSVMEL